MKKKIIWIVVILVLAVLVVVKLKMGAAPTEVELGQVNKGNIDKYIEETAVVKLAGETSIYSGESGRIAEMLYNAGDNVKAGDIIARMDDKELQLQKKGLEAQKQSIAAQFAELKNPDNSEEINRLSAQVRSAEAAYENARRVADNNKALYDAGTISNNTYQESLTELAAAEAALESAQSSLELAQKGISGNVAKQYEAQISGIQAQIEQVENRIGNMTVKSPIDGIVMTKASEVGSVVQSGALLYTVGSSGTPYLESDILADEIGAVKEGDTVLINNEDLGIKDAKGKVRKIYPTAFSKTSELGIEQKRVKIEIGLDDNIPELRSGYDMNIKVITESKTGTLSISDKAVFEYQGKSCVFVDDNGTAKLRQIEKGIESDDRIEVVKGLKEGEQVILSPDSKLNEGTKIKAKP